MKISMLEEGARIGRFLVLRDLDGTNLAVAAGAVYAIWETDQGSLLMLTGGRVVHIPHAMRTILEWLDGRS